MMTTAFKPIWWMLALAGVASPALAEDPWRGIDLAPPPGEIDQVDTSPTPLDFAEPDWTLLDTSSEAAKAALREQKPSASAANPGAAWTSQKNADGSSALSVKQSLSPVWDTRIGADLNVAGQPNARSASDAYRNQFGDGQQTSSSGGAAWAAMTAPGVGSVWDKTAIEARVDPLADQTRIGTSMSKSVPIAGDKYSLTLQNGYNVIQQGGSNAIGYNGRPVRSYETDQQARLSISDTGTSFIAGQTMATTDDKWLRKVGAEQKLFGGVNISASVSETLQGPANKSLTAGFKHSW